MICFRIFFKAPMEKRDEQYILSTTEAANNYHTPFTQSTCSFSAFPFSFSVNSHLSIWKFLLGFRNTYREHCRKEVNEQGRKRKSNHMEKTFQAFQINVRQLEAVDGIDQNVVLCFVIGNAALQRLKTSETRGRKVCESIERHKRNSALAMSALFSTNTRYTVCHTTEP